jgi:hypothetical protein
MHVAFDIDGTLDADPVLMGTLLRDLMNGANRISVITGSSAKIPNRKDAKDKINYLRSLGMDPYWDTVVIIGDPPHAAKAEWCKNNHVDILFDNSVQNAKLASQHCLVMLPWNTKQD